MEILALRAIARVLLGDLGVLAVGIPRLNGEEMQPSSVPQMQVTMVAWGPFRARLVVTGDFGHEPPQPGRLNA